VRGEIAKRFRTFIQEIVINQRSGLSFIEFLDCLVAVLGGVVIGSMYLGVDLKQLASGSLEQSQLVDLSLLGWETSTQKSTADPESPPLETQPSPTAKESGLINILSANDSAGSDSTSIESSNSVNTSSGLKTSNQHATETVQPFEMTLAQREAVTKAYWDAVVRCIRTEIQDRRPKTPQEN